MRPMTRTIWSTMLPRRTAASTPSGTPITAPISVPSVASSSVAGKARRMSVITGFVVSTDVPKSPGSALLHIDVELLAERQVEAQSRGACARRHCAGARSPTIASTGSIGMTRPMKKVTASRPR